MQLAYVDTSGTPDSHVVTSFQGLPIFLDKGIERPITDKTITNNKLHAYDSRALLLRSRYKLRQTVRKKKGKKKGGFSAGMEGSFMYIVCF